MALSIYVVKKWIGILLGKSVFTVNQDEGKVYSKTDLAGYYNNLTEKITRFGLPGNEIPKRHVAEGMTIEFSIEIFQYGLAAYDLYLMTNDACYLDKMKACADWALKNIDEKGRWATFPYKKPNQLYSSMAQGEGLSLLTRAYKVWGDLAYADAAKKAKEFMLIPVENGGTTVYENGNIYFYEYLHEDQVLNGWIFSAWGILDYAKCFNDKEAWDQWNNTVNAMAQKLPMYDKGFWSSYTDAQKLANPFYHKLHIAQLNVMYDLTGIEAFKKYFEIFSRYQNNWFYRKIAFLLKFIQKVLE